ncbi:MAG: hypothetical protein AAF192_08645 [Pseudomonadota bacterium]
MSATDPLGFSILLVGVALWWGFLVCWLLFTQATGRDPLTGETQSERRERLRREQREWGREMRIRERNQRIWEDTRDGAE